MYSINCEQTKSIFIFIKTFLYLENIFETFIDTLLIR